MKAAQQKQQKPAKDAVCVWGANKSEAKKQFLLLVAAICWPTRQNSQTVERSRSAGRKEEAAKSNKKQLHEGSRNCLPASSVPAASKRKEKSQKKWGKKRKTFAGYQACIDFAFSHWLGRRLQVLLLLLQLLLLLFMLLLPATNWIACYQHTATMAYCVEWGDCP